MDELKLQKAITAEWRELALEAVQELWKSHPYTQAMWEETVRKMDGRALSNAVSKAYGVAEGEE